MEWIEALIPGYSSGEAADAKLRSQTALHNVVKYFQKDDSSLHE
jgi:hypothetical protein